MEKIAPSVDTSGFPVFVLCLTILIAAQLTAVVAELEPVPALVEVNVAVLL